MGKEVGVWLREVRKGMWKDKTEDDKSSNCDVGLTSYSFTGPPLLNQHVGSGIGLTVKKSNCIASLAQFVTQLDSAVTTHWLSTVLQVTYQLSWSTKISLLGLNRTPKISSQNVSLGPLALPIGLFRHRNEPMETDDGSFGSTALVLESDLDSSTKVGGWVEWNRLDSRYLHWGVSVCDLPEDDIGWGFKVGGSVAGSRVWDRFLLEAFSKTPAARLPKTSDPLSSTNHQSPAAYNIANYTNDQDSLTNHPKFSFQAPITYLLKTAKSEQSEIRNNKLTLTA
ncbi:hypothetical protein E3N88_37963 [Mikania micrantha]|uniref:Uncharacterized protein n=1 Tax=Mikania micrantha TaxID=192012 RepID=A0A5N6LSL7_9ASTR|nr:hypothetical protein E3N88_37963 [Mikania micrantha]